MSKLGKIIIAVLLLAVFFLIGFIVGFGLIADNAFRALHPETWMTLLNEFRSF